MLKVDWNVESGLEYGKWLGMLKVAWNIESRLEC